MTKVKLTEYVKQVFQTESKDFSEWFGYYNYDTLNHNQSKLLCNRASFDGVAPQKGMFIKLGFYDLNTKQWNQIEETDSWNWQQGSMMQWLPCNGSDERVIFNCTRNNHNTAAIYNVNTGVINEIDWAIYGITPDGKKSITLEMERSHWCRAYHYNSVANKEQEGRVIETDGIFEIDLIRNKRKRIISIQDIINTDKRPYFDDCKHWLEHIMISPTGKRFCFLHRFSPADNVFKYETRLLIADIDGLNLQVIPGWENCSWSHFGWKGDDEFVIYTQTPYRYAQNGGLGKLVRTPWKFIPIAKYLFYGVTSRMPYQLSKIIHGKRHLYQHYVLGKEGLFHLNDNYEKSYLSIDGHPSFTNDGRYMITDSYPDKEQYQRLIVFDTVTKKGVIIARLFANYYRNPASCDLHPKLCKDNRYLVVDTAYDSKHHMILFELDWEKIKNVISK